MRRGSWAPRGDSAGCEREQQVCACLRAGWEGGQRGRERSSESRKGEEDVFTGDGDGGKWEGKAGLASPQWRLHLVPSAGPDSHLCTSTSSPGASGPQKDPPAEHMQRPQLGCLVGDQGVW